MSQARPSTIAQRYAVRRQEPVIRGAGGLACGAFVALLGCAFWAGAVFASAPWPP